MATMPPRDTLQSDDPYAREAQTFPRLDDDAAARIAGYGREESLADGASLFARGDRSVDFFLILDGAVEIFETDAHGERHVITVHHARQFTGEMDLFNDREILVWGRAAGVTRVIRVARADFRRMIAAEPDIGETVMRAFILRRVGFIRHGEGGVELVGAGHAADTQRLARFMIRNGYPHRLLDTESDDDVASFFEHFHVAEEDLPVLVLPGDTLLRNPSTRELADALGMTETLDPAQVYDVAVVGAGPAGLAAAVYAASEGLSTLVLESTAPGGQAGTSSKIENYLGFPTGISGQALAGRAQSQAQKFGARLAIAREVRGLDCAQQPYRLQLDGDEYVRASAIVVATGARYRKLDLPDYDRFEGQGIYYAATQMEAALCGASEVVVVGGGNSAGQATMFLSRTAAHVHVLVRGAGLAATMSDYLVQRLESSPQVTIHPYCEVTALEGDGLLRRVGWTDRKSGDTVIRDVSGLFVMIGAVPNTDWLDDCLKLDAHGFIETGTDADGRPLASPFATSKPGVFAVGDVRAGSVKRVASGVGEGSVVVRAIHHFLHPDEA